MEEPRPARRSQQPASSRRPQVTGSEAARAAGQGGSGVAARGERWGGRLSAACSGVFGVPSPWLLG